MNRIVGLVERRAREVRLPRGDAAFLAEHAGHLVEVVPAFRRGFYRVTPRGIVGWFDTPNRRFAVGPKIPWPNVRMLLGLPTTDHASGENIDPERGLLEVLAREFAARLREVVRVGLVAGYGEHDTAVAFLRGKLRAADQMRDAAARAFPDRFHVTESVLDLDTPWNRVPRSVAEELLANPDLAPDTRAELRDATRPLGEVPHAPPAEADFAAALAEPRAAHYRPLLELCRVLQDGFSAARLPGTGAGAFLIDLSRAFERYLASGLAAGLARRPGWSVEAQPAFRVGPVDLQPDILLRRGGPRIVLDAKWKAPGPAPDAADLHQILAYAAVTGAKQAGLVYPGRRSASRTFDVPTAGVRVSLYRVRVVGTEAECGRSLSALARRLIRRRRA